MSKEAMKLALEALDRHQSIIGLTNNKQDVETIIALRKALAEQPVQQEPVAEIVSDSNGCLSTQWSNDWTPNPGDKLYTTPQAQPAPVQEPVQRYSPNGEGGMEIDSLGAWVKFTSPQTAQQWNPNDHYKDGWRECLLAAQCTWVGLTDEEIQTIAFEAVNENWHWLRLGRAIEAKLKEKNNGK